MSADGNQLTCGELIALVTDYLENALDTSDRMRFDEHLAGCTACQAHLAQFRETIASVGTLRETEVPDQAKDDLLAAFRDWHAGKAGKD